MIGIKRHNNIRDFVTPLFLPSSGMKTSVTSPIRASVSLYLVSTFIHTNTHNLVETKAKKQKSKKVKTNSRMTGVIEMVSYLFTSLRDNSATPL